LKSVLIFFNQLRLLTFNVKETDYTIQHIRFLILLLGLLSPMKILTMTFLFHFNPTSTFYCYHHLHVSKKVFQV